VFVVDPTNIPKAVLKEEIPKG